MVLIKNIIYKSISQLFIFSSIKYVDPFPVDIIFDENEDPTHNKDCIKIIDQIMDSVDSNISIYMDAMLEINTISNGQEYAKNHSKTDVADWIVNSIAKDIKSISSWFSKQLISANMLIHVYKEQINNNSKVIEGLQSKLNDIKRFDNSIDAIKIIDEHICEFLAKKFDCVSWMIEFSH